ncbi:MAG: ABC transporter permease [Anaerolineaceae bacterium]|nr:ABC transporter permease [Anaerolineaceae bacterium]
MLKLKWERMEAPFWFRPMIPVVAILATLILTSVLIVAARANPLEAFYYFLIYPLSSQFSLFEVLVKATPLLLTGAAVTFAFAAGYWNIGAEGQLLAGAIAAAWIGTLVKGIPPVVAILMMIAAGFIAGMLWALIPALLKTRLAVDEIVTTLLMNTVITFPISFLLNGPWRNPATGEPQSPEILANAYFPHLVPRSRLHIGFILALIVLAIIWVVLSRTSFGLRMRAIGLGQHAARFAGVRVEKTMLIAALVSGGIAGLAGVGEVAGIHFHLISGISGGDGYTGIIVAMLGGLNPIGVGLGALFIGLIETGAQSVSQVLGVPIYLGNVVEATLLLVTLSMLILQHYRLRRV